jgi:hypothetical protein
VAGGVSADYYVGNRLFINESARITLTGSNSLMITGSSTSNVRMYPALNYGLTGTTKLYDQNQKDADSRNVVVDYKTGEVSCRPMFNVSTTGPSTTVGYPEGFVWYQTGTPAAEQGNSLAAEEGWVVLPGGILMQWGTVTTGVGNDNRAYVQFVRAFSAVPWSITVTPKNYETNPNNNWSGGGKDYMGQYQIPTATGMYVIAQAASANVADVAKTLSWIAIGKA